MHVVVASHDVDVEPYASVAVEIVAVAVRLLVGSSVLGLLVHSVVALADVGCALTSCA